MFLFASFFMNKKQVYPNFGVRSDQTFQSKSSRQNSAFNWPALTRLSILQAKCLLDRLTASWWDQRAEFGFRWWQVWYLSLKLSLRARYTDSIVTFSCAAPCVTFRDTESAHCYPHLYYSSCLFWGWWRVLFASKWAPLCGIQYSTNLSPPFTYGQKTLFTV